MVTLRERIAQLIALIQQQPAEFPRLRRLADEATEAGESELAIRALLDCAIAANDLGRPIQADGLINKASRLALGVGSPLAADTEYLRCGFLRERGEHDASTRGFAALVTGPSFKRLKLGSRISAWQQLAELCRFAQAGDAAVACLGMAQRECEAVGRPMHDMDHLNHLCVQMDIWFTSHPLFSSMLPAGPQMRLSHDARDNQLADALQRCERLLHSPEAQLLPLHLKITGLMYSIGSAAQRGYQQELIRAIDDFHAMRLPTPRLEFDLRLRLARALLLTHQIAAAVSLVASASPCAEPQIDAPTHLQWLYFQSQVARVDGRPQEALTLYERYVQEAMPLALRMNLQVRGLMHTITQQHGARPQDQPLNRPAYLEHAKQLIQQRPRMAIAAVADEVSVTERTLHSAFSVHEGISPKAYQIRMRLEAVRSSIESGRSAGRTVEELADEHGFSHAGRFSSAFKKLFGIDPGALRDMAAGHTGGEYNSSA